jgi:hypothetical protein
MEVPVRVLRSLLAIFVVGALSLTFTACGDDGGSPLAAEAGDDNSSDTGDDSAGDSAGDSSDDLDLPSDDELDDLADLAGVDEACLGGLYLAAGMFGFTDEASAKEAQEYFEEARDDLPDEIRDDFDVVADAMRTYGEVLAEHDYDFAKLMADADAQAALEDLESPEYTEATDNLDAWFSENCDTTN